MPNTKERWRNFGDVLILPVTSFLDFSRCAGARGTRVPVLHSANLTESDIREQVHRHNDGAAGVLASLSPASEISDCRCFRTLPTTRNASHVCWLGWFAIRPQFRRQGFGTAAIHQLCHVARSTGSKELWIYTDSHDEVARIFYLSLGFEILGPASDHAPGKTMDDSDVVLRRTLVQS